MTATNKPPTRMIAISPVLACGESGMGGLYLAIESRTRGSPARYRSSRPTRGLESTRIKVVFNYTPVIIETTRPRAMLYGGGYAVQEAPDRARRDRQAVCCPAAGQAAQRRAHANCAGSEGERDAYLRRQIGGCGRRARD